MSEAQPTEALPIVTFEDGVTIWFNGEEVEAVHLPSGHTDGDAVIFFKHAHVVHMGDLFFNGSFPFIDRNSGGDLMGYVKRGGRAQEGPRRREDHPRSRRARHP